MTPSNAYVAIGGNIGEVRDNLARAVRLIDGLESTRVAAVSPLFRTTPVAGPLTPEGKPAQPDFLNGAIAVETALEPEELLTALQGIERELGRVREIKDGPRTVDLDIVLWEGRVIDTRKLTLPHPRMHLRGFVLAPLASIAPGVRHPATGETVAAMLEGLGPLEGVEPDGEDFAPLERAP